MGGVVDADDQADLAEGGFAVLEEAEVAVVQVGKDAWDQNSDWAVFRLQV